MTVLLVRHRMPLSSVAPGGPHAELAAELISLPSGLLAMVCEATGRLKVRLRVAPPVRERCIPRLCCNSSSTNCKLSSGVQRSRSEKRSELASRDSAAKREGE